MPVSICQHIAFIEATRMLFAYRLSNLPSRSSFHSVSYVNKTHSESINTSYDKILLLIHSNVKLNVPIKRIYGTAFTLSLPCIT